MKFKIDENLPVEAAVVLRDCGFEADTVGDESLTGVDYETLAISVRADQRILVTLDLDFANIRAYPPDEYAGIVVLRPKTQEKPTLIAYTRRLAMILAGRDPSGELWIVGPDRLRVRRRS